MSLLQASLLVTCAYLMNQTPVPPHAQEPVGATPVLPPAQPSAQNATTLSESATFATRIAPEDALDITVLGHSDLTRTVIVLADGKIAFPYLGSFQAGGLTLPELTQRMTLGLSTQVRNPQLTISFRERRVRKVSINGPVRAPGERSMREGWTVLNLVADSGGLTTERPEWVSAMLLRANGTTLFINMPGLLAGDPKENPTLQEGDILLVQERDTSLTHVQVLGEVLRPGPIPVPKDGSVATAVAAAGGASPRAALTRTTLKRGNTLFALDLSQSLVNGTDPMQKFALLPGDTIFIPQNKQMYAVFGAVNKGGEIEYPDGARLTVTSALARCGGWSADADLKKAAVIRPARPGQPTKVTELNLESLAKGNLSQDIPIEPGDLLFVPSKTPGKRRPTLGEVLSFIPLFGYFSR